MRKGNIQKLPIDWMQKGQNVLFLKSLTVTIVQVE
jgi:hypothetical protein